LGFAGLPRRIHDFPAVFLGWQGMATSGQFITLIGVAYFFAAIGLSHADSKHSIDSALGFHRWQKRAHYYLYKIKWNQQNEELSEMLPFFENRLYLRDNAFNEYEVFRLRSRY